MSGQCCAHTHMSPPQTKYPRQTLQGGDIRCSSCSIPSFTPNPTDFSGFGCWRPSQNPKASFPMADVNARNLPLGRSRPRTRPRISSVHHRQSFDPYASLGVMFNEPEASNPPTNSVARQPPGSKMMHPPASAPQTRFRFAIPEQSSPTLRFAGGTPPAQVGLMTNTNPWPS